MLNDIRLATCEVICYSEKTNNAASLFPGQNVRYPTKSSMTFDSFIAKFLKDLKNSTDKSALHFICLTQLSMKF